MGRASVLSGILLLASAHGAEAAAQASPGEQDLAFFETEIRPLFAEHCSSCHGAEKQRSGLRLDSREAILRGGDRGPAVQPFAPDDSLLVQAVRRSGELAMPPRAPLSQAQVEALAEWVRRGAAWPAPAPGATSSRDPIEEARRSFWSFQPLTDPAPPAVADRDWPTSDLDRFVLAGLEARGLSPAPPAEKRALLRRVTFDLTGLPPTPAEVDAFLADDSPDAFARVVDRLLDSPRYGERWARHWLDLIRYTDSFDTRLLVPGGENGDVSEAWKYRDWVVDSLNRDLPYADFVVQQIAGDLVAEDGPDGYDPGRVIATGMLALGDWGGGDSDKEKLLTDIVDDQVDVVSRAFLGLTVACARCHDHKFDPIRTEDYYGLAGIFMSSHILADPGPKTGGPPMLKLLLLPRAELDRRYARAQRHFELGNELQRITEEGRRTLAEEDAKDSARYLLATREWTRAEAQSPRPALAEFAAARELDPGALRQWLEVLGLESGQLLRSTVRDVLGRPEVLAWKNAAETPSVTANRSAVPLSLLTFVLPERSISVHPSPAAGVAVEFECPKEGTFALHAHVADADRACGDGIEAVLERWRVGEREELGRSAIDNGGSTDFEFGAVPLARGDRLRLAVLPRAEYTCDTTAIDWKVTQVGGGPHYDLAADVLAAVDRDATGDLAADGEDREGVWSFLDLAAPPADPQFDAALQPWREASAAADRGEVSADALLEAAHRFESSPETWLASPRNPLLVRDDAELRRRSPELAARLEPLEAERAAIAAVVDPPPEKAVGIAEGGVPNTAQAGVHDVRVHVRGRYDRLGDVVPRRFPEVLAGPEPAQIAEGKSGRLELARWITDPRNPLTARVLVNRVWQHHFGQGLVRTPSNFGKQGEAPTHPELLDWLVQRFLESGGSWKALHRTILLSRTWQQSSVPEPRTLEIDPENRLLGRVTRRRLEAEELRDSLLAVTGELDETRGGPSIRDPNHRRRTLYTMTIRSDRATYRELFDAADPTSMVAERTSATVAPQALYLMNNTFVLERAQSLAEQVLARGDASDADRIRDLYPQLFGRPALEEEVEIGLAALQQATHGDESALARARAFAQYVQILFWSNEWMFVD